MPLLRPPYTLPLRQWLTALVVMLLLLGLITLAYWPGLGGGFIFDDLPNLSPWQGFGDLNNRHNITGFLAYANGTPGRPLSLLSFVVDDQSWPPDIFTLKRNNLALHLLNSCLVFWLALKIIPRLAPAAAHTTLAALLVALVWSLHPLQVSNVSYIIQRMNLLSTLLILAGMLLFLHGRALLATRPRRAWLLCSLSVGAFLPLAILAKENGLLLCVFLLLLENFCFPKNHQLAWRAWKFVFLWGPLLLFVAYCLYVFKGMTIGFETRHYNAWERLLTQGPVLVDYLNKLLIPRLHGSGLFNDNFPVSRSLAEPYTVFCWLLLIGLLACAWGARRKIPLFAFGIFFYFGGHLMESTVMPLELYFEHRNYLPQFGLWLAGAGLILHIGRHTRLMLAAALLLLTPLLAGMTYANASLWGQSELQTAVWYRDNPGSLRTTLAYANLLVTQGRYDQALAVLAEGRKTMPDILQLALAEKYVNCYLMDRPDRFDDLPALARSSRFETASLTTLEQMWKVALRNAATTHGSNQCRPASGDQLIAIYSALLENPHYVGRGKAIVNANLGAIYASRGNLDNAIYFYDQAFASEANPLYAYTQATLLASAGLPESASHYNQMARAAMTWRMQQMYPALLINITKMQTALDAAVQAPAP